MVKPTISQCEEWLKFPLKNPISGRSIQEGKGVYNELKKECEKLGKKSPVKKSPVKKSPVKKSPVKEVKSDCDKWKINKKINPVTGKRMIEGKGPYNEWAKKCSTPKKSPPKVVHKSPPKVVHKSPVKKSPQYLKSPFKLITKQPEEWNKLTCQQLSYNQNIHPWKFNPLILEIYNKAKYIYNCEKRFKINDFELLKDYGTLTELKEYGEKKDDMHDKLFLTMLEEVIELIQKKGFALKSIDIDGYDIIGDLKSMFSTSQYKDIIHNFCSKVKGKYVLYDDWYNRQTLIKTKVSCAMILKFIVDYINSLPKNIKDECIKRLYEELMDGKGTCIIGRISRIINSIRGIEGADVLFGKISLTEISSEIYHIITNIMNYYLEKMDDETYNIIDDALMKTDPKQKNPYQLFLMSIRDKAYKEAKHKLNYLSPSIFDMVFQLTFKKIYRQ